MKPPIGVPRIYLGNEIPVVYPGEIARSGAVSLDELVDSMTAASETPASVPLEDWVVEPRPGARGVFLRLRYRLVGQWVDRAVDYFLPEAQ